MDHGVFKLLWVRWNVRQAFPCVLINQEFNNSLYWSIGLFGAFALHHVNEVPNQLQMVKDPSLNHYLTRLINLNSYKMSSSNSMNWWIRRNLWISVVQNLVPFFLKTNDILVEIYLQIIIAWQFVFPCENNMPQFSSNLVQEMEWSYCVRLEYQTGCVKCFVVVRSCGKGTMASLLMDLWCASGLWLSPLTGVKLSSQSAALLSTSLARAEQLENTWFIVLSHRWKSHVFHQRNS